jgi:hypothetical protein
MSPFKHVLLLVSVVSLGLPLGCGSEEEPEQPVPVAIPSIPTFTFGEGHLEVGQRGLALDQYDLQVLPGIRAVTTAEMSETFGRVVINAPFVQWPAVCAPTNDGPTLLPAAKVVERLAAIRAAGITTESVAVNVDILTPGRIDLYHVCFSEGAADARFDVAEYRRQLINAFTDLAGIDGVDYVTVGLDMNVYYHADIDGERRTDDYTNFLLLYREIFAAMKATNPDLRVGPGLNYTYFRGLTMDAVASEFGLEKPAEGASVGTRRAYMQAAAYYADKRTVEPFLVSGRGDARTVTADFVGLTFLPFTNTAPYNGEPAPSEAAAQQLVDEWHAPLHTIADIGGDTPMTIVVPQADWPEGAIRRPKKASYLATLKRALSPFQLGWLAWRRFSDLPDPDVGSPCAQFTRANDPALNFSPREEYCGSGAVDQYGTIEDENSVYRTLTQTP